MAEKNEFAVVCRTCAGTGKHHFEHNYTKFTRRKDTTGVKRVIECNPGIGVGIDAKQNLTYESFGGMPFKEWEAGLPFPKGSEMRNYTCPAWWYQCVNYDLKPAWEECGFGAFSNCEHFKSKEKCWKRFDNITCLQAEVVQK